MTVTNFIEKVPTHIC